jgi:hypothetical protein
LAWATVYWPVVHGWLTLRGVDLVGMGGRQLLNLLFVTQFDIAYQSGMEHPWDEYAKHAATMADPLVITQRIMDEWGTSEDAQRGMEALMALMPEAMHAPAEPG